MEEKEIRDKNLRKWVLRSEHSYWFGSMFFNHALINGTKLPPPYLSPFLLNLRYAPCLRCLSSINMVSSKEHMCVTAENLGLWVEYEVRPMAPVLKADDQPEHLGSEKQLYSEKSDLIDGLFILIDSNTPLESFVWLFKVNYLPFMGSCFHT